MEKEKPEKAERYLTQADLEADLREFAKAVKDKLCDMEKSIEAIRSESREPKEVQTAFYRCGEEGCEFVTDDLGVFVEHTVEEKLRKHGLGAPEETFRGEGEPTPKKHTTFAEFLDCPECYPKFEKVLLEKGWKKPEPKRKGLL